METMAQSVLDENLHRRFGMGDAVPEATTGRVLQFYNLTSMRNISGLLVACVELFFAFAHADTINVLTLGAKRDGSADISEIVNANTKKSALFFPAGIYKVAHPLVLKNPIRGEGYSRTPVVDSTRTWFVSEISCTNAAAGVVEFGGDVRVNIENLNVMCRRRECGIRIADCRQNTFAFIDKVGIYNVASWGVYVKGGGTRLIFFGDMTIFGTRNDPLSRAAGIRLEGTCDCRVSNIEIMGVNIGMELFNAHTYGDNLHIWTGVMGGVKGPREMSWWNDTRGIVLGPKAHFTGSEVYPDTCYYAFDLRAANSFCEVMNVMYWEDNSVKGVKNRTGAFVHYADTHNPGKLVLSGGLIGTSGSDTHPGAMMKVYMPEATVHGVSLKTDYAIRGANIDRLCLSGNLPDYTVHYADKGWCKVADIFTVAKTGACQGVMTLNDGAAWRLTLVKGTDSRTKVGVEPLNALCGDREIKSIEEDEVVKVYVLNTDTSPMKMRFTTTYMCDYFRPVDHASLRSIAGLPRYRDIREILSEK